MVHRVLAASHRRVGRCHAGDNGVTTLSKLKTVELKLPATTEDLRKLEIGTVVYLTGRLFTSREGVYKKAIEQGAGMPATNVELGTANFHCSPAARIEPDGTFNCGPVPATASFRFAKWRAELAKRRARTLIIGN